MQKESVLDKAIIAYRENPTEENRKRLMALQAQHNSDFIRSQTQDFIKRTT